MIKLISIFLLLFGACSLKAYYFSDEQSFKKHFLHEDQIVICANGIFICLEEDILLAKRIFHEECGFYYLEEDVHWICQICGEFNSLNVKACKRCGTRY